MSAADFPGLLDVMSVGKAKIKYNLQSKTYKDYPANEPEEVYFASRAQMNQVEQMASYMATWWTCSHGKGIYFLVQKLRSWYMLICLDTRNDWTYL